MGLARTFAQRARGRIRACRTPVYLRRTARDTGRTARAGLIHRRTVPWQSSPVVGRAKTTPLRTSRRSARARRVRDKLLWLDERGPSGRVVRQSTACDPVIAFLKILRDETRIGRGIVTNAPYYSTNMGTCAYYYVSQIRPRAYEVMGHNKLQLCWSEF